MAERERKELQFSAQQYADFCRHPIFTEMLQTWEAKKNALLNELKNLDNTRERDIELKSRINEIEAMIDLQKRTAEVVKQQEEVNDGSGN